MIQGDFALIACMLVATHSMLLCTVPVATALLLQPGNQHFLLTPAPTPALSAPLTSHHLRKSPLLLTDALLKSKNHAKSVKWQRPAAANLASSTEGPVGALKGSNWRSRQRAQASSADGEKKVAGSLDSQLAHQWTSQRLQSFLRQRSMLICYPG